MRLRAAVTSPKSIQLSVILLRIEVKFLLF